MLNTRGFLFLERDGDPQCCQNKLKARKDILRKYLDSNNSLELEALFALQKIYVKYNKPAGMLCVSNSQKCTIFGRQNNRIRQFCSTKVKFDPSLSIFSIYT